MVAASDIPGIRSQSEPRTPKNYDTHPPMLFCRLSGHCLYSSEPPIAMLVALLGWFKASTAGHVKNADGLQYP